MKQSWILTALEYTVAAALGGAAAGYALGTAGALLPLAGRLAVATLLAAIAVALGAIELAGKHPRVLQCARETPRWWVEQGAAVWALRTGLALGCGATTRVGFWVWFTVPVVPLLCGDPLLGTITYGAYGLVRGAAVFAWVLSSRRNRDPLSAGSVAWVLSNRAVVRRVAAAQLMFVGLIGLILVL